MKEALAVQRFAQALGELCEQTLDECFSRPIQHDELATNDAGRVRVAADNDEDSRR